jgi:hypothetical protein
MRAMSETTNNPSNTTAAEEFDGHSVIAVSFEDDGNAYGLFVGSLFDIYDADAADSALGAISSSAKVGHAALLAVVDEPSTEIVDAAMSDAGGTIARRPLADVEAEIAAAEDAEREAKREARKELHRARRDRDKAAVNAKVEELKGKLHHGQQTEAAGVR